MGKRKKLACHYCWVCGRRRPNEKFSGTGHAKHVCRECRPGAEELAFRQMVRNLKRCVTWEGHIRQKQRAAFERYLRHEDPRVRAMAEEFQRVDAEERELMRAEREGDDLAPDTICFDGVNHDDNPF